MKLGKKVVGLIATGFLLAACGGTKEAAEKVDSGNLAAEQKISISSPAPISTLDTTQTTDKNTFTMAQHLFEGLYRFDDDSATVPALAKDVKITTLPCGRGLSGAMASQLRPKILFILGKNW